MSEKHYRNWVGPEGLYDVVGANQFAVLTAMGLRETHKVLDIGCGSLRMGRFCVLYLREGNYFGIEPEKDILSEGMEENLGSEIIKRKNPSFDHNTDFQLDVFNQKFDYIIAQSIFSHASENQIKQCLSKIRHVLKDDGVFLFNWGKGNEDYKGEEWVYPGCVTYRTETIEGWIKEAQLHHRQKHFENLSSKFDWAVCAINDETLQKYDYIKNQ